MKPKKIRTKIEETSKDKEDLLLKMAFSGQLRETTMVANTAIAGNLGKEIQKRLAMLPEYQTTRCGVMSCATGEILPGVAVWGGMYTLKGAMARMRVRVLLVFRGDYCETWALPMEKVDSIKALPDSAFSRTEVAMLIDAANALAFLGDTTDHVLANGNPADKATLNTIKNEQPKVSDAKVVALLERKPYLIDTVMVALNLPVMAYGGDDRIPGIIRNHMVKTKESGAREEIIAEYQRIYTELNRFNALGMLDGAPIMVEKPAEIAEFVANRLIIIKGEEVKNASKMVETLSDADNRAKAFGCAVRTFPTVPVFFLKTAINAPGAVDYPNADEAVDEPLTSEELETLRAVIAGFDVRIMAHRVVAHYLDAIHAEGAHREKFCDLLDQAIWEEFVSIRFGKEYRENLLHLRGARTEKAMEAHKDLVKDAVRQLCDVEGYADQIADKPGTKDEAQELLDTQYWAFRYRPEKGRNKGRQVLAFSTASLDRFLQERVGGTIHAGEVLTRMKKLPGFSWIPV